MSNGFDQFRAIMEWSSKAEGLALCAQHFSTYPGSDPVDAWIRTITANLVQAKGRYFRLNDKSLQDWKALFGLGTETIQKRSIKSRSQDFKPQKPYQRTWERRNADDLTAGVDHNYREVEMIRVGVGKEIRRTVIGRNFFLSDSGYRGFGPLALRRGDMICILQGFDVPFWFVAQGVITAWWENALFGDWWMVRVWRRKKETAFEVIDLK